MSFKPSIDTINFIFTNTLRDLTDQGDLFIGGGNMTPYMIYLIQQQQKEISELQSKIAAQSTQANTQQTQISQLMSRLDAANIA